MPAMYALVWVPSVPILMSRCRRSARVADVNVVAVASPTCAAPTRSRCCCSRCCCSAARVTDGGVVASGGIGLQRAEATAVLTPPVVLLSSATTPTAVLLLPVVLFCNARSRWLCWRPRWCCSGAR